GLRKNRRHDRAGRVGAAHPSRRRRGRAQSPPRSLEATRAALRPRLWRHVLRPYRAGRRRLRLRFPRRQGSDSRTGNPLDPQPRGEVLMKVGLFDHVEHGQRPLATLFDERLTFAKAAEEAGIYCLHVAEHHATPLNMVPVPGVYLGALARETSRLRLGPLVYLLPLYSPLRLIEPIALRPVQQPHPAFWYGSSNTTGAAWAGEHGMHFVSLGPTPFAKTNIDAFKQALAKRGGPAQPKAEFPGGTAIGVLRHIFVA